MKQGEIWLASLDPTIDSEQGGTRPVLIISGNAMNDNFSLVIICPITSKIKNFIGDIILEPDDENGLNEISEVMIFQIRSFSKNRLIKKIGIVQKSSMALLIQNLNKILKY
ncbi:MAG: type II toxin-antitoxin system PemK/MazF family toxin [Saprospiraceae bacterium]